MDKFKRILVISRMIPYSRKAIDYGISLTRKYGGNLHVLHLVSNPVDMLALNAPGLFPEEEYKNYKIYEQEVKEQLDQVIKQEKQSGCPITELIRDGDPLEEVEKTVHEEKIDLVILSAHAEGRIEHALFGGENDSIIRKMPCSILLLKNEPDPVDC